MSHVFVSYAHEDSSFVNRLSNDLLDLGYPIWQDTLNLRGGVNWENELLQAIDDCTHMLLIWSANTEASGYVKTEIGRAQSTGKIIVPLLISGDPSRLPLDIQALQWIDFRGDYGTAKQKLITDVPLPSGILPPPNLADLISRGEMTFGAAAKLWRSKLIFGAKDNDPVGLLIERSEYGIHSFLVGRPSDRLIPPGCIQVFMHFTGAFSANSFGEYLEYLEENHLPLWTVLVRGPIAPDSKLGLAYQMPLVKSIHDRHPWDKAVQMAINGINRVSETYKPVQVFMMTPVAIAVAFGAADKWKRTLQIYQQARVSEHAKDRYYMAYEYKPS